MLVYLMSVVLIVFFLLNRYVGSVGVVVNLLLGVVGNSLCLLTLCRRNMLKNVSTIYFIALGRLLFILSYLLSYMI